MSTPFALGAVTAVLRQRLTASFMTAGVSAAVGGVTVTATSPDRVPVRDTEANRVNLYLHRVSRNLGWANAGPPPRSSTGDAVSILPTGLDLHYVISAYGQDQFTTDILLGHVVAALADEPVLTRAAIRQALAPDPPDATVPAALSDSRLADQLESITVTPVTAGMEEISRLWSAFQAPLRPSAFYDVTTVLVESSVHAAAPLPVLVVGSATLATTGPTVDTVAAAGAPGTPITSASTLVIRGRGFAGDNTQVRIGSSQAPPTELRNTELQVPLADLAPAVRPGLAGLVVTQDVTFADESGAPGVVHAAAASSPVPVAVVPTLSFGAGAVAVGADENVNGVPVGSGTITATVAPAVGREQQVTLYLTAVGAAPGAPARGAVLAAPPANGAAGNAPTTTSIPFPYRRVPKGSYVARIRVDGVDSTMTRAGDGTFDGPAVTL